MASALKDNLQYLMKGVKAWHEMTEGNVNMKATGLIDKNCAVYIFYSAFVSVYINSGPSIFYTNFLNN